MTEPPLESKAQKVTLACLALAYVAGVAMASADPGPRAWALHSAGFLPWIERTAILALLAVGVILLGSEALRSAGDSEGSTPGPAPKRARAGSPGLTGRQIALPFLLLALAVLYSLLRARTQFLGDGTVWLTGLQAGVVTARSEPLSAALWLGAASVLRALHRPIEAGALAVFPVLCGLVAAVFAWGIARELALPGKRGTAIVLALLLTLGVTQLFCGYIESYPPVAMFVLGFLWLGLRRIRGHGPAILLPIAFALCVGSHFATAALAPSFLLLALRGPEPPARRFALAAAGPVLAVALLLLLGSSPTEWLHALGTASRGADVGNLSTIVVEPAYGILSVDHLVDFLNALLLVLPVPLLLLLARLAGRQGRVTPLAPDTAFLALAALPGVALAALLRLPLPPAQDWDLTAILLLPAAVFAVRAGRAIVAVPGSRRLHAGLAALSLGALLPFLLVNANESAAIRRFETILAPGAKITSFARAYGNYALWKHAWDRGDGEDAHRYALRALVAEPGNPRYWTNAGLDLYRLRRYDEALLYLRQGVRRGPNLWVSQYNLGLCLNAIGHYWEASEHLRGAVRAGGENPEVLHNLGIALYRSGRPDSALVVWREVAVRWPEYTRSLQSREAPAP